MRHRLLVILAAAAAIISVAGCSNQPAAAPVVINHPTVINTRIGTTTSSSRIAHAIAHSVAVARVGIGTTLKASNGTWTGTVTSYTYQWEDCNTSGASCVPITGATSQLYTIKASDAGSTILVQVTANSTSGSTTVASAATNVIVATSSPSASCSTPCTAAPAITGTVKIGDTLSVSTGSWSNSPNTYSYQWEDCNSAGVSCAASTSDALTVPYCDGGTQIPCSSGSSTNWTTYTLEPSDAGSTIKVLVTAANGSSYTATTAPTSVVGSGAPSNSAVPTVSGTASIGSTLTATEGTWSGSGNSYAYQWNDCVLDDPLPTGCVPISGATSSTYTVQSSDGGYKLDVTVTATNSNGSQAVSSAQTSAYVPVPPAAINASIAGQAVLGSTLTAFYHFSGSDPSYTYQWEDCNSAGGSCTAISGATSSTYTVAAGDETHTIVLVVTATNDGGTQTATATSPATPLIQTPTGTGAPANTAAPTITGAIGYGGTITTSVGTWTGTGLSYSYQWQDCNSTASSCTNVVAGGTAYSYTIAEPDIGQYLRVQVTATNGSGSTTADSAVSVIVPTPSTSQAGITPDGITVVGDEVENDTGQQVVLHGADLSGTDTACGNDGTFSDNMPATTASTAGMPSWNLNGIRLGTNEDCWLGINGANPGGTTYQSDMASFVSLLHTYGQYTMLSLTASAPGASLAGPNFGEANAPDEDHSPWYWAGLASAMKNTPDVIDAVWSELATTSVWWNCYMGAGCGDTASANNGPYDGSGFCGGGAWECYFYLTASMQQAVDITRAMGFNGPISIPCIGYAVDCTDPSSTGAIDGGTWASTHPTDPQNQMVAEVHWYPNDACDSNTCHGYAISNVTGAGYPIIAGETGQDASSAASPVCGSWSSSTGYSSTYDGVEGWLHNYYTNGMSGWFSYAWNTFGGDAAVLISATAGTPYETGTEDASGWNSMCVQTYDRSLPGG